MMAEEVHFVKIVQGGIWGDGRGSGLVVVVLSGLVRLRAGSAVVGISSGGAAGVGGAADSLCVRFGILKGGVDGGWNYESEKANELEILNERPRMRIACAAIHSLGRVLIRLDATDQPRQSRGALDRMGRRADDNGKRLMPGIQSN